MPTVTVIQPTLVENTAKIRAAAYCRVSSSSEDQLNSYYFAKRQDLMVYFEPEAFESIVEKIVVISRNELEFHLIGGLKLTEYVE